MACPDRGVDLINFFTSVNPCQSFRNVTLGPSIAFYKRISDFVDDIRGHPKLLIGNFVTRN